ncbi:Hypothetical membrane protein [Corynebacterium glutamicum ATCC 13032]|uniref:Hypothetical membrane protein n=1 Tax=Corynebacterium glutamicum (strain ATCC 13032 / DSM 20300 / JCM 1318 / BCRC 11384 / CCUG 27702 / LMG 3730 / NBRC 12168 / NCIMB 10025 / NRRL B-2784 / 534) TaxID=196627 RepID=Q8NLI5_CORGL|nr:Hypothetical membrane protein [Corynebacterium glutamicum ATCC 13032]
MGDRHLGLTSFYPFPGFLDVVRGEGAFAALVLAGLFRQAIPSAWRSRMMERSNSAKEPRMLSMSWARKALDSAEKIRFSLMKCTLAPLVVIWSMIFCRSTFDHHNDRPGTTIGTRDMKHRSQVLLV